MRRILLQVRSDRRPRSELDAIRRQVAEPDRETLSGVPAVQNATTLATQTPSPEAFKGFPGSRYSKFRGIVAPKRNRLVI